jgi:TonB family protein
MSYLWRCVALIVLASSIAWAQSASPATIQQNDAQTTSPPGSVSTSDTTATPQAVAADSKILEIIHAQKAIYPNDAERAGVQGEVIVRVRVSETGDVEKTEVLSGDPLLVDAAVNAARKFKFKPFIRNGKPVKVATKLPFDFHFSDKVMSNSLPYENDKGAGNSLPYGNGKADSGKSVPGASAAKRVNVSSGITEGMIIRKIAPVYPPEAKRNGIQGTVVLRATIGKDGHILNLTPISGPQELVRASIGAVQQWVYRPYLKLGEPVEVDTQITVNFVLHSF